MMTIRNASPTSMPKRGSPGVARYRDTSGSAGKWKGKGKTVTDGWQTDASSKGKPPLKATYPPVFAGKDDTGRERDARLTLVVQ